MLSGNDIGTASNNQFFIHTVHDIWIACFANAGNHTILDANVGLVDSSPVYDQRVGDDSVETFAVFPSTRLTHTFS